jgi:hypothetical protein
MCDVPYAAQQGCASATSAVLQSQFAVFCGKVQQGLPSVDCCCLLFVSLLTCDAAAYRHLAQA